MSKLTPVFVIKHPTVQMPPVEGAVVVEWEQICQRKDVKVFIDYKDRGPRQTSPMMREQRRPWRLISRSWVVIGCYGSLKSAVKAAQRLAT